MAPHVMLSLVVFLMVGSAILLVSTLAGRRHARLDRRLDDLAGRTDPYSETAPTTVTQMALTALPRMGATMLPSDEKERTLLKTRLMHAGFYGQQALVVFLGVKLLLMLAPAAIGFALGTIGLLPVRQAVLGGGILGILGMIGPSFWLDKRKARRQTTFRRSLPDALDVLVICLEGGSSLPAALRRVATELRAAHPVLASELNVVQREIQLGRSPGEALQQMGIRSDLEEIRGLAAVVAQAERFGASLVRSLRVHAETLRLRRRQQAEEMAQKAAIKILFPTVLLIFPAIFVVILGPAVIRISEVFGNINK